MSNFELEPGDNLSKIVRVLKTAKRPAVAISALTTQTQAELECVANGLSNDVGRCVTVFILNMPNDRIVTLDLDTAKSQTFLASHGVDVRETPENN